MDKMELLKQTWPDWELSDLIGYGQYGRVYRIEKMHYGQKITAALKVIEIPADNSEINGMQATGMDPLSIRNYFKETAESLISEIVIMQELKTASNIVSIEDSAIIENEEGIGWTILIRMELLDNFVKYSQEHQMNIDDYVKLGIDMCSAISDCETADIIHRDIKPENVFVNKFGTFKLGDFGIARQMEHTKSTMSRKGTELYMAPEVLRGERYNSTVDIYSLGIMLYRLLNRGRMPFYPPYPEKITRASVDAAVKRKNKGEPFPDPIDADPDLSSIILKACAFRSENRYQNAADMRNDLLKWMNHKPVQETQEDTEDPERDYNKTRSVWGDTDRDRIKDQYKQKEKELIEKKKEEAEKERIKSFEAEMPRTRYNIWVQNSNYGTGDGALETDKNTIIYYQKSPFVRSLFGLLGVSLASGKEKYRFSITDIKSCEIKESTLSKSLTITNNDGKYITFKLKKDFETKVLPIIMQFIKFKAEQ